MISRDEVTTS